MSDKLVVYYSRKGENFTPQGIQVLEKGNTAYAAEYLAEAFDADLFEVDTVKPYAENYRECCKEAVEEAKVKARPEIKAYVPDMGKYDTVFVCYPCWCGTAPMAVFTLLEHYDMAGKKILPLCTNEGSGLAGSEADIQASCPGAEVKPGLSIKGHQVQQSRETILAWAREHM